MIYGKRSDQELKYAKARAKASEYAVDMSALPRFPYDSDDLHYSSIYVLSQYTDARLEGGDSARFIEDLKKTASFYDASANDDRNSEFGDGYWVLAMAAYFLLGNYGSAKVAACRVGNSAFYGSNAELLVDLVNYLLVPGSAAPAELRRLGEYLMGEPVSKSAVFDEAKAFLTESKAEDSFFGRLLYVAVEDIVANSSRKLLPIYTGIEATKWRPYLEGNNAAKVLWQAQRVIGEAGVFKGGSAFIQLPTGSGKTTSVELLIRSRILAGDCSLAVVIAPLRALCSEIAHDLKTKLDGVAEVRLASDVMEIDAWIGSLLVGKQVLVFTPEKFSFVFHHNGIFIDDIDLFVFDEAHLLDSVSRGPAYELLLAEIIAKRPLVQKVLISAVVANSDEIAGWATGDSSRLATGEGIQVTERSMAFALEKGRRITYVNPVAPSGNITDFFLPTGLRQQPLAPKGRERRKRFFPESTGSSPDYARDLAIYYANRLIRNGACAIYVPRSGSMRKLFKRLSDIDSRGADLGTLKRSFDLHEAAAISRLIALHYGDEDELCEGLAVGVLPHYGALQGAVRQSVEHAIDRGLFACVACTSTLAEGVNLPIKYLLITGVDNGFGATRVRDFQNLVGRTARSGKYSEGSVVIFGGFSGRRGRDYLSLLLPGNIERCRSAILNIFSDVEGSREIGKICRGSSIIDFILNNVDSPRLEYELARALKDNLGLDSRDARRISEQRIKTLEAVESYVAGIFDASGALTDISKTCTSTFAFASANEAEKNQLLAFFQSVGTSVAKKDARTRKLCYVMQAGARRPGSILNWIQSPEGKSFLLGGCSDVGVLIAEFLRPNPDFCAPFGNVQLEVMALLWMEGENIAAISERINSCCPLERKVSVQKVEKAISNRISFSLSNFVAGIADVLHEYSELGYSQKCAFELEKLQRKLKYGVSSMRAAMICEMVLDDRMIAKALVDIVGGEGPTDNRFVKRELLQHRLEVDDFMANMPTYCRSRINRWLDQ